MEEKMDSDNSYSGDSSSSSDSSSGSSEGDDDAMEPVRIMGETLELPQELCEDYALFKEFFSMKTWETLEDKHKEHLKQFLPKFTEDTEVETEKTIKMLFNFEPFHFTSPLSDFHTNLKQGNYRPDIAKMRKFLRKARSKQQRHKVKSYYAKLLPEVLISRERLLAAAKSAPPGPAPRIPTLPPKLKNNYRPVYLRAQQRYFEELAAIRSEVGGDETDDDNYPEGPPEPSFKKQKHVLGLGGETNISGTLGCSDQSGPNSLQCLKKVLASHRSRRQYRENHPELNTTGISIEDIKQRVQFINGAKKLMFGGQKAASPVPKLKRPKKEPSLKQPKQVEAKIPKKIKEEIESIEHKPLLPNIKIKQEKEESDSESSTFVDPVTSPIPAKRLSDTVEIKQEVIDKYPNSMSTNYDPQLECVIKQEPLDPALNKNYQPVPIKLEDLDGIDMMALPIEIADDSGEVIQVETSSEAIDDSSVEIDDSLTETTHANFLALVRALFPARDAHRASKQQLHARCYAVMKSPIAPLNTWYNLSDDWCGELDSALDFLAGERGTNPEDFVPYLQYMPETQIYQWIGAGRDCDAILSRLCERWLRATSPQPPSKDPPPAKYPTSWTVRAPTPADVAEFRTQERRRFASAAKPFTYTQHGYRSVVGPPPPAPAAPPAPPAPAAGKHKEQPPLPQPMELEVGSVEEVIEASDSDVDVDDSNTPSSTPQLSSAQLLMQATQSQKPAQTPPIPPTPPPKPKPKLVPTQPKKNTPKQTPKPSKQATLMSQSVKQANLLAQAVKANLPPKPNITPVKNNVAKQTMLIQPPKTAPNAPKQTPKKPPVPKVVKPSAQSPKTVPPMQPPTKVSSPKVTQPLSSPKTPASPKPTPPSPKTTHIVKPIVTIPVSKTEPVLPATLPIVSQSNVSLVKTLPTIVATPHKSPLIKQRTALKQDNVPSTVTPVVTTSAAIQPTAASHTIIQPVINATMLQNQSKMIPGTRSLLIRSPGIQTSVPSILTTPVSQAVSAARRGVVRVLSPAHPTAGKSLISPRALLQDHPASKKRATTTTTPSITTLAQNTVNTTTVASSTSLPVPATVPAVTRTVQLAGGRTVQLAANQTVHLPTGQSVQLSSGHTLQLSSLQLSTHSVRLPSGQTVQLATPQTMQALKAATPLKTSIKPQLTTSKTQPTVQIPVSTVQLAGQTVQIAGQTVQLAGQSVQLTGHTVKLPSGQSVQVASQSVQLPSGQTVQLASGNVQTVQIAGSNVQLPSQSVQLPNNVQLGSQTVQLSGQTVQLGGQTVQLSSGQTIQLPSGQTVQLTSGQTLQLASGQTVQLGNQAAKSITQVVRSQSQVEKPVTSQPIVAKLLTNAQGQMVSLEGVGVGMGYTRAVLGAGAVAGARARAASAVRVLPPGARLARPVLLTAAKPLHNILLQQSDGTVRVTSAGGVNTSQTLVISNIAAQTVTTPTTSTPVLKLQQVNPLHQVKLAQGIKLQQSVSTANVSTPSGVRSVVMDGQQLKLVGGRHVLARILRPAQPPPAHPPQ